MENENQKGGTEKKNEQKLDKKEKKEESSKISGKKIILFLLLGLLIGIFLKTQVFGSMVIGYNDSGVENLKSDFDYEEYENKKAAAEKDAAENNQANPEGAQVETTPATGGQCGN